MIKRILVNGLLTSVLQIGFYALVIYTCWSVTKLIHDPQKMTYEETYEFNFTAELSIVFFGLLLLVTNLLIAIINRRYWTWAVITVLTSIFVIDWIRNFESNTWETSLFTFAWILTIFSKFAIEKMVHVISKKIESGFIPKSQ